MPPARQGEDNRDDLSEGEKDSSAELLLMMGHVMAAWQAVEHVVFEVYRCFFDKDHGDVAAVVYFSVRTFEARMRVADALVNDLAGAKHRDVWDRLHEKIRKLARTRNEVAHGLISFVGKAPRRKALIGPSVYDVAKFPGAPRDHDFLSANALKQSAAAMAKLAAAASDFKASLEQDAELQRALRARPQRLETNDQKQPLTARVPQRP